MGMLGNGSCGGSAHAELFIYRIALVNYSFGLDIFSTTKIDLERGIMWLFSQKRFEHRLSKTRRRGRNFDCSHMQRRKVPVKKVEKMVLVLVIFGKPNQNYMCTSKPRKRSTHIPYEDVFY